ncbi:MAG: CopG family transcriptional regulator [Trueperaceae bacterium]
MIRKQLYLEEAQDKALKRRAKELGVSEAEVVRRALDESLSGERRTHVTARQALESFLERADHIARTNSFPEGYRFDRQALYEEDQRFKRWDEKE